MKTAKVLLFSSTLLITTLFLGCSGDSVANTNNTKALLGKALFTSKELSQNKTMACDTCHDLNHAMIDSRTASVTNGASTGDDGVSIGDRNAPTATYAAFTPDFGIDDEGLYVGGQFLDGRASNLKAQAKGPFLNPVEMNMTNATAVVNRVQADASLASQMKTVYGASIFDNDKAAYDAVADAIATFESTTEFSPFDSKFDRAYDGSYTYTAQEVQGKTLFESKGRCIACHPINGYHPLITDHSYDNLGVPENTTLRGLNGVGSGAKDKGLRTQVGNPSLDGTFKVPSLRNVAVTGPYMHNGVFKNLKTVIHFYNTRDIGGLNPEDNNTVFKIAEVPSTVNHTELGELGLSDAEEDALVAFLKTFTDQKFEHLIP